MEFDIEKDEFISLVKREDGPALVQLVAEVETSLSPLDLYTLLENHFDYSYILESVEKESRHARFSFVGADPLALLSVKGRRVCLTMSHESALTDLMEKRLGDICDSLESKSCHFEGIIKTGYEVLDALRKVFVADESLHLLNANRFDRQTFLGGAMGYAGYDIIYDCWLKQDIPAGAKEADMQFMFTTSTFVFDHLEKRTYYVKTPLASFSNAAQVYDDVLEEARSMQVVLNRSSLIEENESARSAKKEDISCTMDRAEYEDAVRKAKEHILDGDIFQVVLSRRYELPYQNSPLYLYRKLRSINPSPYMYLLSFKDVAVVGASPETLMTVDNGRVITNPIAGTCPRGESETEDCNYAEIMLHDEKERAEHVMLVDLSRNDVRMVCEGGSVKVSDFMKVVRYSHVQHIESTVEGKLRPECDQFDAIKALLPAGTLSGAPKIRAMEIIRKLEGIGRGVYGGGIGYFSWNGDADFAIAIRTVVMREGHVMIQAGAGIVADSVPSKEYEETERKMAAMLKAVRGE
jgi:anthranilate synthase component 1